MKAFRINKPILVQSATSNIDVLYGPYIGVDKEAAIAEALDAIVEDARVIGRTFAINVNDQIEEYWFNDAGEPVKKVASDLYGPYEAKDGKDALVVAMEATEGQRKVGTTVGIVVGNKIKEYQWMTQDGLDDLPVEKVESNELEISIPSEKQIVTIDSDAKTFSLTYVLKGRSFLSNGYLYINDVVAAEFTPEISQTGASPVFLVPNQIGRYHCRIAVVDVFGQRVTTDEYTLNYGTISAYFNTQNVQDVLPKSQITLNNVLVQATVNTIDKSEYLPVAIQLGNRDLYKFNSSDTYPKSVNIYLPSDLVAQTGAKFSLKYRQNNADRYIYDSYEFDILRENQVSIVSDGNFEGFENDKLVIPVIIESGNPTFMFNLSLTMGGQTFTYTNAPGNQLVNFIISRLPNDIIPSGETEDEQEYTLTAVNVANANIRATKPIRINIKKITSTGPYVTANNYFIFNTNLNTLSSDTLSCDTITDAKNVIVYYKNQDVVTFSGSSKQIMFDTYVNISKTGQYYLDENDQRVGDLKVPVMQLFTNDGVPFITITEEEVLIGSVTNPTLLTKLFLDGEYKHIAVVYNKKEISEITGNEERYDAIYINGVLIANVPSKGSFYGTYLKTNPLNRAVFDMASLHIYCYGEDATPESFESNGRDVIYRNYVSNLKAAPSETSCAKLQLININNLVLNSFKTYNKKLKRLVPIGTVSGGKVSGEGVADTLLRMNTASKNLKIEGEKQQKAVATFCYYQYTSATGSTEKGITEVHTQGTSTLDYPVPNFKFNFFNTANTNKEYKTWVTDLPEKELTAKADYMDSSHLNNTPTCIFYNNLTGNKNLMSALVPDGVDMSSQSYARSHQEQYNDNSYYYTDAIFGEPCIIEYTDNQPNVNSIQELDDENKVKFSNIAFTNLGSFMLNADKSAISLGLNIVDDSENSYLNNNGIEVCYSLEGKSNIDSASDEGTQNPNAALFLYTGNVVNKIPNLPWNFTTDLWNALTVELLNNFKNFVFVGTAFEFRSDLDPDEWESLDDLRKYLYPIARMWYFVARSTDLQFVDNFDNYFNRNYAFLYYINLMCFAQVDNLGKNSMFDTWDGLHWYPRPYDLDSQAGFNNQGVDSILTYEEILPTDVFTGGYHRTDINTVDEEGNDTTQATINALDNKNFSSKSSNLWKKIWNGFSNDIITFYATLRENGYSAENVISNAKNIVINKIPANQYNIDFRKKYLGTTVHQTKGFGNRWDKFRWWITKRFEFCDTYFKYSNTIDIATKSSYTIHVDTPQYIYVSDDSNSSGRQLMLSEATITPSPGVVAHISLSTNSVTEINGSELFSTFTVIPVNALERLKLNNLITLDLHNNKNNINIDNLYYTFNVIRTINISDSTVMLSKLPETVLNFYADNVTFGDSTNPFAQKVDGRWQSRFENPERYRLTELSLKGFSGALVLSGLPLLESVDLTGANISYLKLENLPNLKTLNISNCKFAGDVDIVNIEKETLDFSNSNFNGHSLNFSGTESNINTLKLNGVKGLNDINLDVIKVETLDCRTSDIKNIYISQDDTKLKNFYISPGVEKIGNLSSVTQYTADMSNFKGLLHVSFYNCNKLVTVQNLNYTGRAYWSGVNTGMFEKCKELTTITSCTINATTSCQKMFAYCYKLTTINTVTIQSDVTSVNRMFCYNFSLPLNKIQQILNTTSSLKDYYACCAYATNFTEVDLNGFFGENEPTDVRYLFAHGYASSMSIPFDPSPTYLTSQSIPLASIETVTGKLPSTVVYADMVFTFLKNLTTIPNDMFGDVTNMISCSYAFTECDALTIPNITKTFFGNCKNTLTTVTSMFGSCDVFALNLAQTNIFEGYSKLTNVAAIFSGCENVYGDVTGIFETNPNIKIFENVFNGTSVILLGKLRTSNFSTAAEIGGMFANNKASLIRQNNIVTSGINIEVLNNFNTISMESANVVYTATGGGNRRESNGVFEGCKDLFGDFSSIVSKMEDKDCSRMFKDSNAADLFDVNITTLTVPNVTSASKLFMGCNFRNLTKLTQIAFGTTNDIRAVFCNTQFNANISQLTFDDQNEQLDYLFAASDLSFDVSHLQLPLNVISTRYMFSHYAPFKSGSGNDFVRGGESGTSIRTNDDIDKMFSNAFLSYNTTGDTDHYEAGTKVTYAIQELASNITGTLSASAFGSTEHPLEKLRYTGHMFDKSAIVEIEAGLFANCINITDCRFMFARCRALRSISGAVDGEKDIFTGDTYNKLRDVSGMFYNSSIGGEIGISLVKAGNLERADAMFGYIYPLGHSPIQFTQELFNNNNSILRSISQFATLTKVNQWPNMSDIFGILQYAKFAFAFSSMTNEKAASLFTDNSRFLRLKDMTGLFASNTSLDSTNINTITFSSSVVKTGNFYNTGVTSGINVNTDQVDVATSYTAYIAGAYV